MKHLNNVQGHITQGAIILWIYVWYTLKYKILSAEQSSYKVGFLFLHIMEHSIETFI